VTAEGTAPVCSCDAKDEATCPIHGNPDGYSDPDTTAPCEVCERYTDEFHERVSLYRHDGIVGAHDIALRHRDALLAALTAEIAELRARFELLDKDVRRWLNGGDLNADYYPEDRWIAACEWFTYRIRAALAPTVSHE